MPGNPDFGLIAVGNRKGRPPGALNYVRREAREMALKIVQDPEYRESLRLRAIAGTLGTMEPVLWYYAFGKPIERVALAVGAGSDLGDLTLEELLARATALTDELRDAAAIEAELLPPENAESEGEPDVVEGPVDNS